MISTSSGFTRFPFYDEVQTDLPETRNKDAKREFGSIKKIGAAIIAEPCNPGEAPNMVTATFADPDNNSFQLWTPWENS